MEVVVCGRVSVVCEKEWLGSGRVWLFVEWCGLIRSGCKWWGLVVCGRDWLSAVGVVLCSRKCN